MAAGAQRISDTLANGLRANGHQVRTVFLYRKTSAYDDDPNVDFLFSKEPTNDLQRASAIIRLITYFRQNKPDAVITFQHYGNILGSIAARLTGRKIVIANQTGTPDFAEISKLVVFLDKFLGSAGAYSANIANSAWTKDQFQHYPKSYRRHIHVIPHGVEKPRSSLTKQEARKSFDLPLNKKLLITGGRHTAQKNQLSLIPVLKLLPDVHLAIAGVGPQRQELLDLAEAENVRNQLHLLGEVPFVRMNDLLVAGDIFVFPSITETFGLAVVEAAIAGLPIVCNDLPILREVLSINDQKTAALFVPASAPNEVATAISSILNDPKFSEKLTSGAQQLAEKYAPHNMVDAYSDLL